MESNDVLKHALTIEVGTVVWIGVTQGVVLATVVEIESRHQEQIRLRDRGGRFHIRHVLELYADETAALRARIDQEAFWEQRYRAQADDCRENLSRLKQRLLNREFRQQRHPRPIRPRDGVVKASTV